MRTLFTWRTVLEKGSPEPFIHQPRKIVKQTQTDCLSVSDHFVGLALKRLIVEEKT